MAAAACKQAFAFCRKSQGIFQVAFEHPQNMFVGWFVCFCRCFHYILNFYLPGELSQEKTADLIYSHLVELWLPNQTINIAGGSGLHMI